MTTTEHAPSRGTAPAGEAGTATRTGRGRRREGRAAWVLALPFCALFLTFTMWPVVQSMGGTSPGPGLTSENHFSTAARAAGVWISPATTSVAFDGW